MCDLGRFDTRCNRLLYFIAWTLEGMSGCVRRMRKPHVPIQPRWVDAATRRAGVATPPPAQRPLIRRSRRESLPSDDRPAPPPDSEAPRP